MGLINIEELCKLDRFRDVYIPGTYTYKTVEILNDEHKVCSIDNPTYRKVIVRDAGLVDENKKGIIDEMVRMCFELKTVEINDERCYGIYDKDAKGKYLMGAYLRHKTVGEKKCAWDTYFLTAQKIYNNEFKSEIAKNDYESYVSEGRYEALKCLIELCEGKYNYRLKELMDFEINAVDDFKQMINNEKLSTNVCNYLLAAIKNNSKKISMLGRHVDKLVKQVKRKNVMSNISYLFLDKSSGENEDSDIYDIFNDEVSVYDNVLGSCTDDKDDYESNSIIKYFNENRDKFLTEASYKYLKDRVTGEFKTKHGINSNNSYDARIRKIIIEEIEKSRCIYETSWGFENRKDIIETLEKILSENTPYNSFRALVSSLKNSNYVAETILIDLIYSLDVELYRPIVVNITEGEYDFDYINNEYIQVVEALQNAYNFYIRENKKIYNFNKTKEESKIAKFKKYIDANVMKDKVESFVSINNHEEFVSIENIKVKYQEIFNKKIKSKNDFCKKMKELGYTTQETAKTKNNIRCDGYKLMIK